MTATGLARAAYGTLLTIWPAVLLDLDGPTASKHPATVVRILGLRHLAQAAALTLSPTARHRRIGAAVDTAHTLTGITCAALCPQHRRAPVWMPAWPFHSR